MRKMVIFSADPPMKKTIVVKVESTEEDREGSLSGRMTQTSSPSAPSRAHADCRCLQLPVHLVDMTHSPCQRLVSTGQYIWGANNIYDPIQSGGGNQPYYYDQLIAPTSGVTGLYKSWKVSGSKRLSLSSVLQAQTLSQSMSGCSQSLQTMRLSQPIPQPRQYPRSKAHHPHSRRWISDSAEDNKLSSYLRPTTTSPGTTGMSAITSIKELTALDLRS